MHSFGFFLFSKPKDRCGSSKHCSSPRDKAPQQVQEQQRSLAKDTVPSVTLPALGRRGCLLENYYIVMLELEN